uniref:C-Jun-amino-terminal kinase-interacting protein 1-like n=1 Tax=Saccoglossus kowalevskii TaxID=10224 RepID=A0ABM0MHZ1_SACKO|nr:PREDICTED: c-Jun-amino-terminal kinase-interacting protein 1-like [Saccoglossus kowalevskii]
MADGKYNSDINSYRLIHDISLDNFQSEDILYDTNDFANKSVIETEILDVGFNNDKFKMTPEHKRYSPKSQSVTTQLKADMVKLDILDNDDEFSEPVPKQILNILKDESKTDKKFYIGGNEEKAPSVSSLSSSSTSSSSQKRGNGRKLPAIPVPPAEGNLQNEIEQAEKAKTEEDTKKEEEYGYSPEQCPPTVTIIPTESPGFHFDSISRENRPMLSAGNLLLLEDSINEEKSSKTAKLKNLFNKSDVAPTTESPKKKSDFTLATLCIDGEIKQQTHLVMFRFLPRHEDEIELDIGDPIYVENMCDDLWYEGVNLRNGCEGCFPGVYVREISEDTESEPGLNGKKCFLDTFLMKFLGSVEVPIHKGNDILCKAMQKIVTARRMTIASSPPTLCLMEISNRGIKMTDQSKPKILLGKGSKKQHDHFFSLKNVSFCGYHPKNDRYFGFITKHPSERRFACHVYISEEGTSSKPVAESVGRAFRRFYDEFLEYTNPTEDIYME